MGLCNAMEGKHIAFSCRSVDCISIHFTILAVASSRIEIWLYQSGEDGSDIMIIISTFSDARSDSKGWNIVHITGTSASWYKEWRSGWLHGMIEHCSMSTWKLCIAAASGAMCNVPGRSKPCKMLLISTLSYTDCVEIESNLHFLLVFTLVTSRLYEGIELLYVAGCSEAQAVQYLYCTLCMRAGKKGGPPQMDRVMRLRRWGNVSLCFGLALFFVNDVTCVQMKEETLADCIFGCWKLDCLDKLFHSKNQL